MGHVNAPSVREQRVLVVDDLPANLYVYSRSLTRGGYAVIKADSGTRALEIVRSDCPHAILLDVKLPDISGFELVEQLRADPVTRDIPIIQISACYTDDDARALGLTTGADVYVCSPVDPKVLVATVRAVLRARAGEGALKAAVSDRDRALAMAAHDLRNPAAGINLSLQGLDRVVRHAGDSVPTRQIVPHLERAMRQSKALMTMLESLLDVSSIGGAQGPFEDQEIDLAALAADIVQRHQEPAALAGCTIGFHSSGPLVARFDSLRFEQILSNLLSNAIKYDGGHPIDVALDVDGAYVRLVVRDRGVGIAPGDHDRIFEQFGRVSGTPVRGSHGLGLWIVKQIVQASGGSITVDSAVGEGATFTVRLPLLRASSGARKPTDDTTH